MKVCINSKFIKGPYGGGVIFANYLKYFLEKNGVKVVNNLKDNDIDIILHVNPFSFLKASSFSAMDAFSYKLKHPLVVIIQRINECDERKNTNYVNRLLIKISKYSDAIIFIASWLKPLLEKKGLDKNKESAIILHGADNSIFNTKHRVFWNKKDKMRIVTHHWGDNYLKGHDFYQRLDSLLDDPLFRDILEFTYVGNLPKNLKYKNTNIIPPLSGEDLANEIKKHDVYITASRNEPAGMHHVEGALCGLPLLYINSGALPEYCEGYGLEFNADNFEDKLLEMYNNFETYLDKVKKYDRTAEKMATNYYHFFINTYLRRGSFKLRKPVFLRIILYFLIRGYSICYFFFLKISGKFRGLLSRFILKK